MIEVQHLTKRYGGNLALNDCSFTVEEGTILGFLGPNGAGKSTAMNIITGYLAATSGSVTVNGMDITEHANQTKKCIGYLPEQPPLYMDMTVREYLSFMYDLKKVTLPREKHLKEICALVRVTDVYGRLIANLSKGYRQRVGIAQALLGNPPVLILDEPTVGLDPKQIIEIRNLIKNLGRSHTVILSSHILPEVQAVCDRLLVVNKGRIVADGTPDGLAQSLAGDHRLIARIEGPQAELSHALANLPHVIRVDAMGEREPGVYEYVVEGEKGTDPRRDLFALCVQRRWALLGLKNGDLSLEDLFLRLTSGDNAEETELLITPDAKEETQEEPEIKEEEIKKEEEEGDA